MRTARFQPKASASSKHLGWKCHSRTEARIGLVCLREHRSHNFLGGGKDRVYCARLVKLPEIYAPPLTATVWLLQHTFTFLLAPCSANQSGRLVLLHAAFGGEPKRAARPRYEPPPGPLLFSLSPMQVLSFPLFLAEKRFRSSSPVLSHQHKRKAIWGSGRASAQTRRLLTGSNRGSCSRPPLPPSACLPASVAFRAVPHRSRARADR